MSDFYLGSKWKNVRKSVLIRDNYIDQVAKRFGKIREGTVVHHIFPRDAYPEYTFERWNLITVSITTHNMLHDRNTDKLTKEGMNLLRRTARKYGLEERIPGEDGVV